MTNDEYQMNIQIGAGVVPQGGTHFRVWAPRRRTVGVVVEGAAGGGPGGRASLELTPEGAGYFSGVIQHVGAGGLYRFRLDGEDRLYADPASRYQPEGPHGPSRIIDPSRFEWPDQEWRGVEVRGKVIYEMHIGTLTREGVWAAAVRELVGLPGPGI